MSTARPKAPIRRFDVFAEYNRQEALKDGMPEDVAKGYGLWLAKLVAARRYGRKKDQKPSEIRDGVPQEPEEKKRPKSKWRSLSGENQTDKLFEQEIVERMGKTFYSRVFVPAIRRAIKEGEDYTEIRDKIRADWRTERGAPGSS